MTQLYTDEEKKNSEAIQQKLSERQQSDLRKVLQTAEGRRVIWRMTGAVLPFQTPFAGLGADSLTFINIGRKEVALTLYAEIEANQPELLMAMRREAASDKLLREAEIKGETNG